MIGFKLSEQKKPLAAMVVASFVFTAIGWWLAVQPVIVKVQSSKGMAEAAKERSKLVFKIHSMRLEQADLERSLTSEENRHMLLGRITALADKSGLKVQSLIPSSAAGKHYMKLTMDVKTQASFYSLLRFLQVLEESEPSVSLTALKVQGQSFHVSQGQLGDTLQIDFTLETYLKIKKS